MDDYSDVCDSDESKRHSDNDDELGRDRDLKESPKFDDFAGKKKSIYNYDEEEEEEEEEEDDGDITESLLVQMGYGKTETKNRAAMPPAPGEEVEEEEYGDIITEESRNQMGRWKIRPIPKHEPPSIPIPADNLKSAMKGSSNREEKSPGKERKVTWADDVFDSIPSHFTPLRVEANSHSHNKSRQNWGKEKNKSGGTGKDKKRKGGGKGKKQQQEML